MTLRNIAGRAFAVSQISLLSRVPLQTCVYLRPRFYLGAVLGPIIMSVFTLDDRDPAFAYTGFWGQMGDMNLDFAGTATWTNLSTSTAVVTFTGGHFFSGRVHFG